MLTTIKGKLAERKKLHKLWQINKCPALKIKLNKALKNLLKSERNKEIQRYLSELSPTAETILFRKPETEMPAITITAH